MVTVTLTLNINLKINRDHLHSKKNVCQIWRNYVNSMSTYHSEKVWSIYPHVDDLCALDVKQIDLRIDRDHIHSNTNNCTKFEEPRSILCLVIIRTRFGPCINMLTVTVTLTFVLLNSKSIGIIYTSRRMSVPNLTNLGQFCHMQSNNKLSLNKIYVP